MITAEVVPPESGRYAARVLVVPGLWAGTHGWRGFARYLAHRGWECHLLTVGAGGIAARAAGLVDYVATLAGPAVLLGHDAGAVVAVAAASPAHAAAVVAMAPLVPGGHGARGVLGGWRSRIRMVAGRPLPASMGGIAPPYWGTLAPAVAAQARAGATAEDAAFVRELCGRRAAALRPSGVPTLLLAGADDALLPPIDAQAFATAIGAEVRVQAGGGHWPHLEPGWPGTVGLVHRWLVRALGEPLLELYAEMMAEREDDDE